MKKIQKIAFYLVIAILACVGCSNHGQGDASQAEGVPSPLSPPTSTHPTQPNCVAKGALGGIHLLLMKGSSNADCADVIATPNGDGTTNNNDGAGKQNAPTPLVITASKNSGGELSCPDGVCGSYAPPSSEFTDFATNLRDDGGKNSTGKTLFAWKVLHLQLTGIDATDVQSDLYHWSVTMDGEQVVDDQGQDKSTGAVVLGNSICDTKIDFPPKAPAFVVGADAAFFQLLTKNKCEGASSFSWNQRDLLLRADISGTHVIGVKVTGPNGTASLSVTVTMPPGYTIADIEKARTPEFISFATLPASVTARAYSCATPLKIRIDFTDHAVELGQTKTVTFNVTGGFSPVVAVTSNHYPLAPGATGNGDLDNRPDEWHKQSASGGQYTYSRTFTYDNAPLANAVYSPNQNLVFAATDPDTMSITVTDEGCPTTPPVKGVVPFEVSYPDLLKTAPDILHVYYLIGANDTNVDYLWFYIQNSNGVNIYDNMTGLLLDPVGDNSNSGSCSALGTALTDDTENYCSENATLVKESGDGLDTAKLEMLISTYKSDSLGDLDVFVHNVVVYNQYWYAELSPSELDNITVHNNTNRDFELGSLQWRQMKVPDYEGNRSFDYMKVTGHPPPDGYLYLTTPVPQGL